MLILNPMNEYRSAFPILEIVHIAGIACGVGTAVLVNLRLLGIGLTQNSGKQLWKNAMPWTLSGLALAILAGLLLFSIDPEMYYVNPAFRFKMLVLLLAIAFYFTMVRKAVAADSRGGSASLVACISLGLWTLVPFGGVFIGFIGSTAYTYPVLLSVHVLALVLLGGMVVLTDLRWLGLGMRSYSAKDVVEGLRVLKRIAFGLAAASGVVLFAANAGQYANNPWFWLKIALLALIGASYLLFRRTAYEDPGRQKLASGLSLILWTGVVIAARGPATVKDIMHSMVDPSGDFLFHSVQTIADDSGVREIAPHTDAEWDNVRERLIILQEAPDLLEGRRAARIRDRSKNPEVESQPEEIQKLLDSDRATFILRAQRLRDAASVAMKAVDAKDKDALLVGLDGIDKACESCHLRYWYPKDKRAHEAAKQDGVVE
ncbi:MAG: hypothetical protein LAP61_26055 [Acidobacteriia bacterium]|nr:hypothetical protein [Terriglobia bacterium]